MGSDLLRRDRQRVRVHSLYQPDRWRTQPHLVQGTVQADFLGADQVSALVGVTLGSGPSTGAPPPALSTDATCAVAIGPATQTVYVKGFAAYASTTYQDAARAEHTVTQVLGEYPDPEEARAVFEALTKGVQGCHTATRTGTDQRTTKWDYAVDTAPASALAWTALEQDSDDGWPATGWRGVAGGAVPGQRRSAGRG